MPKVFDGRDFDIHELEEPIEVKVVTAKEHVSKKLLVDLQKTIRDTKPKPKTKSLSLAISASLVLPGLGSVYLKRTFWGIALLSFNLFFVLIGVSSLNLLSFFLSEQFITGQVVTSTYPVFGEAIYHFAPVQFAVLFVWASLFILVAWAHLIYLLVFHRENFKLVG